MNARGRPGRGSRSPAPDRARAVTILEVMVGAAIAVMLLVIVYDLFISSRRGMARGEAKLDYLTDAGVAFLVMQRDLHAATDQPEVLGDSVLRLRRRAVSQASDGVTSQVVSYTRIEGARAEDGGILRRIDAGAGPDDEREKLLCRGNLREFRVRAREVGGQRAYEIGLAFRAAQDAQVTRFTRLLVARNAVPDISWRPVRP